MIFCTVQLSVLVLAHEMNESSAATIYFVLLIAVVNFFSLKNPFLNLLPILHKRGVMLAEVSPKAKQSTTSSDRWYLITILRIQRSLLLMLQLNTVGHETLSPTLSVNNW